jgi:outer membrane protein assembly factor BamB
MLTRTLAGGLLAAGLFAILLGCSQTGTAEPPPNRTAGERANAVGAPSKFDWPQWQGTDRSGVSPEAGLLKEWPKDGPTLLWNAKGCGDGYSTPSVSAGRIFLMGNRDKKEYVLALSDEGGKELWAFEVGPVHGSDGGYPGPRCTPTVDGDRVYALGLAGDLVCLSVDKGKLVWRKDLKKEFKGQVGGWGYSESPLIDGQLLICTPGGKEATLVALDKMTGEPKWKSSVPDGNAANYSSPIAYDVDGQRQYAQFLSGGVVGVSAGDGKFLWKYKNPANGTANCSTPIFHDGGIFAASGYGTGGGMAALERKGDEWQADQKWFTKEIKNHHGGVVLIDGYLYGSNEGMLVCIDWKTGKTKWDSRVTGKGSIAAADGRLYYRNEGGPVFLVEVNPEKYVQHGKFEQPMRSGKPSWPHPVIANGKLYLRDQDVLLCYDVKAGKK